MNIRHLMLGLSALAFASPAFPQQTAPVGIAALAQVHGNVLVSKESGLAAGNEGARLVEGSRVITTSNSGVIVVYDDGCRVELKANQRFQVDHKPCAVLVSQAESILAAPATSSVPITAGALTVYGVVLPALGATGVDVLTSRRGTRNVSPS
jgi:hypothetical protein